MSEEPKGPGALVLGWWRKNIEPRDNPAARALAARVRRAAPVAVLCEPRVQELGRELSLGPGRATDLVRLGLLLAEVRENNRVTLARRLGGDKPVLSHLRFQRLLRAEGDELTSQLRRAIIMSDRCCNIAVLASDLLYWDEARPRWCFHYFGADSPAKGFEEINK